MANINQPLGCSVSPSRNKRLFSDLCAGLRLWAQKTIKAGLEIYCGGQCQQLTDAGWILNEVS